MKGSCDGCPSSTMTLKNGVENLLKNEEKIKKSPTAQYRTLDSSIYILHLANKLYF